MSKGIAGRQSKSFVLRVVIGTSLALLLGSLAEPLNPWLDHSQRLAFQLSGEHWYGLSLEERHGGYLHTRAGFNLSGDWTYQSHTHVLLKPGEPLNIRKTLRFAAKPPNALLAASHRISQGGRVLEQARIERSGNQLLGYLNNEPAPRELEFDYRLSDYLALELQLADTPADGRELAAVQLDVSQLLRIRRGYKINQTAAGHIELTQRAPGGNSVISLDEKLVPVQMRLANRFDLRRTDRSSALRTLSPLYKSSYAIQLDEPITNPKTLSTLEIELSNEARQRLKSQRGVVTDQAGPQSFSGATASFPTEDPKILELLEQAIAGARTPRAKLEAIVGFVHRFLRYEADTQEQSVLHAIARRRGECTEFADLATTLARSAGLPARTVFGLAYAEQGTPRLAFHAWTEAFVDGAWHSVDPTWNQVVVDATHIPMDPQQLAEIKYFSADQNLHARTISLSY